MKKPVFNITPHLLQFSVSSERRSRYEVRRAIMYEVSLTRISVYSYCTNKEPSLLYILPSLVSKNIPCYYVSVAFSSTKAVLRGKMDGNYVFSGWLLARLMGVSDVRIQTDFRTSLQTNGSLSQLRVHQTRTEIHTKNPTRCNSVSKFYFIFI